MFSICLRTMPGPLSRTVTRNRLSSVWSSSTWRSGRMPASSQASSELSTASLTVVSSALRGLSNPSRWRFLAKNSETEISRWLAAIDSAVAGLRALPLEREELTSEDAECAAEERSEPEPTPGPPCASVPVWLDLLPSSAVSAFSSSANRNGGGSLCFLGGMSGSIGA